MQTQISTLRKDSDGIVGTYRNANHHAETLLPFIEALEAQALSFGFKEWKQGHNVHEFVTSEGRRYTLRPIGDNDNDRWSYTGVRLSLRVSRSQEYILFDATDMRDINKMVTMLKALAQSSKGVTMKENKSLQ